MKIKFYCLESLIQKDGTAPIQVSISHKGRAIIHTQMHCSPSEFPKLLASKKPNTYQTYCKKVESDLLTIYNNLQVSGEVITAQILKDIFLNGKKTAFTIQKMYDDVMKIKIQENLDPTTYKRYEAAFQKFYAYTDHKASDLASSVKYSDIITFRAKLLQKYTETYTAKMLKCMKTIFAIALRSGWISATPFILVKINEGKPLNETMYLTNEEMREMENKVIINDRLDKVRDLFLFQAYTGLSYVDMKSLTPDDIQESEGQYIIKKKRVKTSMEFISVVFPKAKEIWDLYKGNLPIISNQKYDLNLKDLAKLLNIDKPISSHYARHTYAMYCLNDLRLDIEIVGKMLGHSKIEMTNRYAKLLDNTVVNAVSKAQDLQPQVTKVIEKYKIKHH